MKLVQIGANKGNDDLAKFLKRSNIDIEFGLFVEANSLHIPELTKCYEKYQNVIIENVAIKTKSHLNNTLQFFYPTKDSPGYGIASCKKEHVEKHIRDLYWLRGSEIKTFTVPCITIEELFKKYNIIELDWLLLDVEGIDAELLLTTEWSKYNIRKFEFENIHFNNIEKESIHKMFSNYGYVKTISLNPFDESWIKKEEVKQMNVTLYSICKNEEKNIEKFLENSKKFSHTIVVDTGSTDNTVKLLKEAGIEVYEHPQTKEEFDFSVARNTALSYVKTDWAFSLDFNEDVDDLFLDGLDIIENEFTKFNHLRFDKTENDESKQSFEVHTRFHRTKNYKWTNAVHEIPVFMSTEEYPEEVNVDTTIKITKKIHKTISKELFYLDICEREYKKDPSNWYYIWFIFNHYFMVSNYPKALEMGQEYLNISKAYFDTFRILAFIKCSICLIKLNDVSKGANYAFHAVSEAMNLGEPYLSQAFMHLNQISKIVNNPNITIFATGFNSETLQSPERYQAIDELYQSKL
jgi:FkbM family methyltransferase